MSIPLKLKDTGGNIQQMTSAEQNYIAYQVGLYMASQWGSESAGSLQSNNGDTNRLVGSFTNFAYTAPVGTHPSTSITSTTTSTPLYQRTQALTEGFVDADHPITWVDTGGETGFKIMPDDDLDAACNVALAKIFTGNYPGTYRLATASPGIDYTKRVNNLFRDTRTDGHDVVYHLWQRTSMTAPTTVRPVRVKSTSPMQLEEMTDAEIQQIFAKRAMNIVRDNSGLSALGIGNYKLMSSAQGAPTDAGTWVSVGTATDTRQVTTDQTYSRDSTTAFAANYTQNYVGNYQTSYAGEYARAYTGPYTSAAFNASYISTYTSVTAEFYDSVGYTTTYQQNYQEVYSVNYVPRYTSNYQTDYIGNYATIYDRVFQAAYTTNYQTNYVPNYVTNYIPNYVTNYVSNYVRNVSGGDFTATFAANYTPNYVRRYTGNYLTQFQRLTDVGYQNEYAGTYNKNYTGNYLIDYLANRYNRNYTSEYNLLQYVKTRLVYYISNFDGTAVAENYVRAFSRPYTTNYVSNYDSSSTGTFTVTYTGNFANNYARNYTRVRLTPYEGPSFAPAYVVTYDRSVGYIRFFAAGYTGVAAYLRTTFTGGDAPPSYLGAGGQFGTQYFAVSGRFYEGPGAEGTYVGNYASSTNTFGSYIGSTRNATYSGNYLGPGVGQTLEYLGPTSPSYVGSVYYQRDIQYIVNYQSNYTLAGSFDGLSYAGTDYLGTYTKEYTGNYLQTYAQNYVSTSILTYTGNFAGLYERTFANNYLSPVDKTYVGNYTPTRQTAYSFPFNTTYTLQYLRGYTKHYDDIFYARNFVRNTALDYEGTNFAANYVKRYTGNYDRNFVRNVDVGYAGPTYQTNYAGTGYQLTYTGNYQKEFASGYEGATFAAGYEGASFVGGYQTNYIRDYAGTYTTNYESTSSLTYQNEFISTTQAYLQNYALIYTADYATQYMGTFSGDYTGNFDAPYVKAYTPNYERGFDTNYVRQYTIDYTSIDTIQYIQNYIGNFIGNFDGLTITSNSEDNEVYTLYVRIA
jgi:hypothetical protein